MCTCFRTYFNDFREPQRSLSIDDLFRDEQGSTTLTMVISLLVALALLFTSAQVYRINSLSAEVQDVADAAALSAENQVAEFMIAVQFCDATVLSMSLLGLTVTGLGVVALCVPPTAGLAKGLLEAGHKILQSRDSFAERAATVLNKLQKTLPYLSAVCAAHVAAENNSSSSGSYYLGASMLVPIEGVEIEVGVSSSDEDLIDKVDEKYDHIKEKAQQAEDAAKKAQEAKQKAYEHDCGNNPSYCMYERAEHLAGLTGATNPFFSSIDTWSFSHALERARVYYRTRLQNEAPASWSVEDRARSALRTIFYTYATEQMNRAYVRETADTFEAYFPHLPRNTSEMRQTHLYTDNLFPISQADEEHRIMHAWSGCPGIESIDGWGSLLLMEAEDFFVCPTCSFTAASLGKVAAASTAIENGFEYHYEIVATEAENYRKAYQELSGPKSEVQEEVSDFLSQIGDLLKSTFDKRISATPPGRYGAIAFVVNTGTSAASEGFQSTFVNTSAMLGPRAAVSSATLVGEESPEGKTVINSLLDGLKSDGGVVVGAAGLVLDAWAYLLHAYTDGNTAISEGIQNTLESIPLIGPSGLGTWASKKFTSCVESLGLQPAELRAFKAVLVNSSYVAERGNDSFSQNYCVIKQRLIVAAAGATDLFSLVLNDAQATVLNEIESLDDSIEIASIELLGPGSISLPVSIPLPKAVKSTSRSFVEGVFSQLQSLHAEFVTRRIWR